MNLFSFVKERVSMLDVAREYVSLKRAGIYHKGRCPFHQEKDASFTVSPHKDIFYCFGCHATGDVIGFIATLEHCTQLEAAHIIIEKYGLDVPPELLKQEGKNYISSGEKQRYYTLCEEVMHWCVSQFECSPEAREYLEKRKITQQTVNTFKIGYFPGGQQSLRALTQHLQTQGFLIKDLLDAGIFIGETHYYSPFEQRIIFPISDHLGRICGFGGRVFKEQDERAKYYNSRESAFFNKGALIFGLEQAKNALQEQNKAFLVEGYADCVMMVQHGYTNTVATLGTACTSAHLNILGRYVDRVYVLYDGDKAGIQAVLRLTHLCWDATIELWVMSLPSGEDPASYLANGNAMHALVNQAQSIFSFFIQTSSAQFHRQSLKQKLAIVHEMVSLIAGVADPLKRELLVQEMALATHMSGDVLRRACSRAVSAGGGKTVIQREAGISVDALPEHEKKLCALVVKNPALAEQLAVRVLVDYVSTFTQRVLRVVLAHPQGDLDLMLAGLDSQDQHELQAIMMTYETIEKPEEERIFGECVRSLWKTISAALKERITQAQKNSDQETVSIVLQQLHDLKESLVNRSYAWQRK